MQSARSASSRCRFRRRASVGVVGALLILSGRWPSGQRPDVVAVRVHASAGWGQPAVGDASVFYLSKHHQLIAVDRMTGAERWRRVLDETPATTAGSSVVLTGTTVIAGDGDLFAFDAQSGAHRWRTVEGQESEPGRFLGSAAGGAIFAGSATGWLTAWSTGDGRERWRVQVSGIDVTVFAPVADERVAVAAFTDFGTAPRSGGVVAVDVATGRRRWLTRFPRVSAVRASSAGGPPSIGAHVVAAASTDGTVYFMNLATGEVQWTIHAVAGAAPFGDRRAAGAPVDAAPDAAPDADVDANADELVDEHEDFRVVKIVSSRALVSSLSGALTAVDLEQHDAVWRYQSPQDGSLGFGLTVAGASAHVPFASGRVAIVDVVTGRARAIIGQQGVRFDWPPAVANHRAYLTAEDGLYVVDLN